MFNPIETKSENLVQVKFFSDIVLLNPQVTAAVQWGSNCWVDRVFSEEFVPKDLCEIDCAKDLWVFMYQFMQPCELVT